MGPIPRETGSVPLEEGEEALILGSPLPPLSSKLCRAHSPAGELPARSDTLTHKYHEATQRQVCRGQVQSWSIPGPMGSLQFPQGGWDNWET